MKLCLPILVVLLVPVAIGCQSESEGGDQRSEEVDQQEQEATQQSGGATGLVETPKWSLRRMVVADQEWDLSLDGKPPQLSRDRGVTISFASKQVRGHTGCNHFSGSYVAKPDGTFKWQSDGVTEMPCPGELAEQQAALLRVLSIVDRWQVRGQVLALSDAPGSNMLEFVPYNPPALPLKGVTWRLTHFTQSSGQMDSAEPVLSGHSIEFQIQGDQGSGSGGCNQFQCECKILAGGRLAFQAPTATKKRCQDDVMKQEDRFFRYLPQMTQYTIRKNILSLTNEPGALGLQFEGVEAPPE